MSTNRPLIGQILIERFHLLPQQLEEGIASQKKHDQSIGQVLIQLGYVTEEAVLEAFALQWGLPFLASLSFNDLDAQFIQKVPISYARRHALLPFKKEGQTVLVATSNPFNMTERDDLHLLLKAQIQVVVVPSRSVVSCMNHLYEQITGTTEEAVSGLSGQSFDLMTDELVETEDLLETNDEGPIIRLVNSVLFQAVTRRASDVHIEPFEQEIEIRYRIDGTLYHILSLPKQIQSSLTSRVKIMATMNIAEKRLPQDGRITLRIGGREVDVRVSSIPIVHGERLVLRLLDKSNRLLDLEEIGFSREKLSKIEQLIKLPHGLLLWTGPTGSGKTTSLYGCLNRINDPDKNIITIEDPVEYKLRGVGQIQVNPKIDLTFANGLRSILRQDPDVIMVGEIRDVETAEIAIHASLTGHLVFSTLHTNDASGAIVRLLDMGIEPFLVVSSVVAVVAQRLIRLVCRQCCVSYCPTSEELHKLGIKETRGPFLFYRGTGCAHCLNTGYFGRSGIFEMLLLDDELRGMILSRADLIHIKAAAVLKGMVTLREDGALQVINGLSDTTEILRVTQNEVTLLDEIA